MAYKEIEDYRCFTKPAVLHKAINTLKGIVSGVNADGIANEDEFNELTNWCELHSFLSDRHPFDEIIPLIYDAKEDGIITGDEVQDILWVCGNILNDGGYYDAITCGIQQLEGLLHGLLADNYLSDKEIKQLDRWLSENDFLCGCYPFDEIQSIVISALSDGKVTEQERDMLKVYFSSFIDLRDSYNLNSIELDKMRGTMSVPGVCAIDPQINFKDTMFSFTGKSVKASRNEIAQLIEHLGGHFINQVTQKTQYLIVGNEGNPCWAFACYGRKVEDAINLRKKGTKIMIINEIDFWDHVLDYTEAYK